MIPPRKVKFEAKKKWNENIEFRTFLKFNANEAELDEQFKTLHKELFAQYDCSRCRNCCKMYPGFIPKADVERDANYLHMDIAEFKQNYLRDKNAEESFQTKHMPCDFLQRDGECMLGECKPVSCTTFPYTDQPERLQSLYSILDTVEVCPVAFEIYERLKKEYKFRLY